MIVNGSVWVMGWCNNLPIIGLFSRVLGGSWIVVVVGLGFGTVGFGSGGDVGIGGIGGV